MYQPGGFSILPPVIKNLIILNAAFFVATFLFKDLHLMEKLALYYPASPNFQPYQIITHMFMHAGIAHIFFNMFALWMFGAVLENHWGPKRFLLYYLICGLGAAAMHYGIIAIQI